MNDLLAKQVALNTHFQNAFKMSDDIMLKYISEINRVRPKVIFAYVQSIYELAKFIKKKHILLFV